MKKAVALRYSTQVPAPFVIGNASGAVVSRLLKIALDYDIPVVEDDILTETLFILNPGEYIPEEVYSIVADIFIFIKKLQEVE